MPFVGRHVVELSSLARWATIGQRFAVLMSAMATALLLCADICFADPPAATATAAGAKTAAEMEPYREQISGTNVSFEMIPIPGGTFAMGSPDSESGHKPDEAPQHPVTVSPFWMGKCEVTWDEYEIWTFALDIQRRKLAKVEPTERDKLADAVTRPTKPYTDMTFGMGKEGFPAICMTQWAAKNYCIWLSAKTGHYYRLPTEAEWEFACRAGTTTAYSFGDNVDAIGDYAWYFDDSEDAYHPVGKKKPNPWGLHDMHGNVAEWCLDAYDANFYKTLPLDRPTVNPYNPPKKVYPQAVRGGSWDDAPDRLRSAARRGSEKAWKVQDPQIPQSIWYFTDALFVGFRIVRPLEAPSAEQMKAYLAAGSEKE